MIDYYKVIYYYDLLYEATSTGSVYDKFVYFCSYVKNNKI